MKKRANTKQKQAFSSGLLRWNRRQNLRQMPWKGEKDPYRIWLSEIILQQTRVEQGLGYYNRFIHAFPDIHSLAKAPEKKIFKLWEGLGYYARCRNLIATAKYISEERNGKFPVDYNNLLSLKGIGPYTAAAISSFSFNLPHAVVDGNVYRVLARVFGIKIPVDSPEGKRYFAELADELLDKKRPGAYNQAIMDFGATVCTPSAPQCTGCIFQKKCYAFLQDETRTLPVKEKKISIRNRWFYYLVPEHKGKKPIRRRTEKDIWQGLYEFPLVETARQTAVKEVLLIAEKKFGIKKNRYRLLRASPLYRQQLSHQVIRGRFIYIELSDKLTGSKWIWTAGAGKNRYAFPRFIGQNAKC